MDLTWRALISFVGAQPRMQLQALRNMNYMPQANLQAASQYATTQSGDHCAKSIINPRSFLMQRRENAKRNIATKRWTRESYVKYPIEKTTGELEAQI